MKRKLVPVLLLVLLVGCAGLQGKWNALTPDEKARIVISDLQGQLTNGFDSAKAYVAANPKYQDTWKQKIVPSFDVANKALASVITIGKTKPLTPDIVYAQVQAQVNNVFALLAQIGWKK